MASRLIVSPHPDDEIIGCWRELRRSRVDAVLFMSTDRRDEAKNSSRYFNFEALFIDEVDSLKSLFKSFSVIYVPHPADHHPKHRSTTMMVQRLLEMVPSIKVKYYSTDMNIPWAIESLGTYAKQKYKDLVRCYPSQKTEFDVNHHWWMFEGITDYPSLPKISVEVPVLGYHSYPNAPERRRYLAYKHQHVFTIRVEVAVFKLDREVEFHDLRSDVLEAYIRLSNYRLFEHSSVEEMAFWIWRQLKVKYSTYIKVCVCEEGNLCGCYGDMLW